MITKKLYFIISYFTLIFATLVAGLFITPKVTQAAVCEQVAFAYFEIRGGRGMLPNERVDCSVVGRSGPACTRNARGEYGVTEFDCSIEPWQNSCGGPQYPEGLDCDHRPFRVRCDLIRDGVTIANLVNRQSEPLVNGQWYPYYFQLPPAPVSPTATNTPVPPTFTPTPTRAPACNETCTGPGDCINREGGRCPVCRPNGTGGMSCQAAPPNETCVPPIGYCAPSCPNGYNTNGTCNNGICCNIPPSPTTQPSSPPQPTATPRPPSPSPTPGMCIEGQTPCNCDGIPPNDPPGSCGTCGGGWCSERVCQTCRYVPPGPRQCNVGDQCEAASPRPTPGPDGKRCYSITFPNGAGRCCEPPNWQRGEPWEIISCGPAPTQPPLVCNGVCTPNNNQCPRECPLCVGPTGSTRCTAPTPTTVQPTEIVSQPAPTSISRRAFSPQGRPAQKWVCLKAAPCIGGGCSGRPVVDHRAKLTSKPDAVSLVNAPTYIFECLKLNNARHRGTFCTTGNATLDQQKLGVSYLSKLQRDYGYRFGGFFAKNGQTRVNSPITSSAQGKIERDSQDWYEWESYTGQQIGRIFLAMNEFADSNSGGNIGQKQSTFGFDTSNKNCVMIKWDPYGIVFDRDTQQPIKGAIVTLYQKNEKGNFVKVTGENILGGIENPLTTGEDGSYDFGVPDGVYKLEVTAPGYETAYDTSINTKYKNVYNGGEIVIEGQKQLVNIPMQSKYNYIQKVTNFLKNFID